MKKLIQCTLLLIAVPVLLGMGTLQGPLSPEKIPIPEKKYNAIFMDQMGVITECGEASIDGTTFLEGKRGEGTYTVPFDKIDQISFRMDADRLIGIVKLRDGVISEFLLNRTQRAYGKTKYGTFQIQLSDLKRLVIRNAAPRQDQ